jgi:hypothetical protein
MVIGQRLEFTGGLVKPIDGIKTECDYHQYYLNEHIAIFDLTIHMSHLAFLKTNPLKTTSFAPYTADIR